jgi:hypothetical protein
MDGGTAVLQRRSFFAAAGSAAAAEIPPLVTAQECVSGSGPAEAAPREIAYRLGSLACEESLLYF